MSTGKEFEGNSISDTIDLEKELNQMVYKLYKLTVEEIKIIEGNQIVVFEK